MKGSRSQDYKFWIQMSTFFFIAVLCFTFYILVVKYLSWKNAQIPKSKSTQESFLDFFFSTNTATEKSKINNSVGIVSSMKQPKDIETWLQKHREMGVQHFYIRLEDTPDLVDFIQEQPDVTLQVGNSKGVNEYQELQKRQDKWVNEALVIANREKNVNWLIHIDADELLHGDLQEIIDLPDNVQTFWMQNEEVKYNKVPRVQDNAFSNVAMFIDCSKNPGKCVSYGNGKGGGRVNSAVKSHGPHRFYCGQFNAKEVKLSGIKVRHYESCDFETYKQKFSQLAVQDKPNKIPFAYYNESILATKQNDERELYRIYQKYRVVKNT